MILTEINIPDEAYCHNGIGYNVVCLPAATTASGGEQGGVGIVVQERPKGWSVESTRFHGSNMVSCEVISGGQMNPLIW